MKPLILNIDSAFDWTAEVHGIWDQIAWEQVRTAVAPAISNPHWLERRDALGMIALVSPSFIDEASQAWQENNQVSDDSTPWLREWRKRQLYVFDQPELDSHNVTSNCGFRFNGEEPYFRSPRIGKHGVVECFGLYADEAGAVFHTANMLKPIPGSVLRAPAIFLCPERMHQIYPTLMMLRQGFRHALPLKSNPGLINLRLTLLHELGHHFFPIHRANAGCFLCEGLANFFCQAHLDTAQRAWLLYKSWHLQPPEYSAYRPLNVLSGADNDCQSAVSLCFHGSLEAWASLPKKDSHHFERGLGAGLNMALATDAAACHGLSRELRDHVSAENKWFFPCDGIHWHHQQRGKDGCLPADLVFDLYQRANLAAWINRTDVPKRFWGRWGYGEEVQWPHDCVDLDVQDADKWFSYYAETRETPIASVVCEKLTDLLKGNPSLCIAASQKAAVDRAIEIASDHRELWFDRVPAIMLIEVCSDTRAIPTLKAIVEAERSGHVYEAARRALAKLESTHGSV